jgi:hypothetical protein
MAPPHLDPETPGSEASKPDSPDAEYRIGWTLRRLEWLATEWPAVVVWGGWAGFLLAPVTVAARQSWWWLVLLIVWWLVGGRKAVGLLVFLLRGGERNDLTISPDGTMFASTNQSEAVYAHWRAFVNQGESFLLWGADGRYRLVIPKRVLTRQDYAAVRERLGIDLTKLRSGQEALVEVHSRARSV